MRENDNYLAIAFDDPGDNGFLHIGKREAFDLLSVLRLPEMGAVKICGYTLTRAQMEELIKTIEELL